MLRSQKRLLKEYLVKQDHQEDKEKLVRDKNLLRNALIENKPIPTELRGDYRMRKGLDLEDERTLGITGHVNRDDEYRLAGTYEPRILITTSCKASQPTVRFAKELKLLFPNSERINRGQTSEIELAELCKRDAITDIVEVSGSDGQGRPTIMRVCHFPFGPTAVFSLTDIVMRADLPEKPPHMPQSKPNLVFHKFDSKIGRRLGSVLKHLFPKAGEKSTRVVTFANVKDRIVVRHHTWVSSSTLRKFRDSDPALENMTQDEKDRLMSRVEIAELGPRIIRGTFEQKDGETEWTKASFTRKSKAVLS